MARKTDVSEEMSEVKTVGDEVPSEQPEQAEQGGQNAAAESRVWVYLGYSISGVVTNGRIYFGSKAEIIESFGEKLKDYPQIERLIVADHNVAKAKSDLKEKRGIYIPYDELISKTKGKEE